MSAVLAASHVALGLYCALCAYVNLNDPDPEPWIISYSLAGAVCFGAAAGVSGGTLRCVGERHPRGAAWEGWTDPPSRSVDDRHCSWVSLFTAVERRSGGRTNLFTGRACAQAQMLALRANTFDALTGGGTLHISIGPL